MDTLLSPPLAFIIYIVLVALIALFGRHLAGPVKSNVLKSSNYGSGEEAPTVSAAPGYRPFILVAFFFAILHLGMLVLGSSPLNWTSALYLGGLFLALVAFILG